MAKAKNDIKSDNELLQEISVKLDQVIAMMAIDGKDQNQQIAILRSFNMDWKTIGLLVGLKPDAARKRLTD